MNIPLQKLIQLLGETHDEDVRASAAVVFGELGVRDAKAAAGLLERLTDKEQAVRLAAIKSVGQLKVEKALPILLERVTHGGPEASAAAEAAAKLGAKGVRGLQNLMHKVAPGLKRYIAAALTTSGSHGADAVGVSVLLDRDPHVGKAAADAIIGQLPTMSAERKKTLHDEILKLAKDRKKLTPAAQLPVLRILAAMANPKSADLLWTWTGPPYPHDVRAAALQTVGGWLKNPTPEQWKRLFSCAQENDFRVAAPALMVLQHLPVAEKQLNDWLALFDAPDVAARRLAMDKLGDRDTAAVAKGIMGQFHHPDRSISEVAKLRLQHLKSGRKALLDALLAAESSEEAWSLVRAIKEVGEEVPAGSVKEIVAATAEYVAEHDPRSDAFLFLARDLASLPLQETLLEKAVALRKKKKYDEALAFLKVLARDPGIGFAVRLELALCGLKVSLKDLDPHSRNEDPCLRNFDTLMQQNFDQLEKELAKAKFLDAYDLLYIAFHFSEQVGRQRQFGIDMLKAVAKEKGDAGKAAKNKLKSVGA